MREDAYGNSIETDDDGTVAAIDRFAASFLAYGTDFAVILDAAERDPDCLLAQTQAALLGLFMENNAGKALAARHLERGRMLVAAQRGGERERLYFGAVEAAARHDAAGATGLHEEIASRWPRDLFAAKLGQIHYFNAGDAEGMRRIAATVLNAHRETAYAWGLLAFGLEECHELDAALDAGRRAAEMTPVEPWAHHAVAHVHEARGEPDAGLAWMEDRAPTWQACNSFMFTHNWWHVALFHIANGAPDRALAVYDTRLWGAPQGDPTYSQDQAGAVSMLIRLELRGLDVGERWAEVADRIAARETMYDQPFLCAHYAYALARSERRNASDTFMAGLRDHADSATGAAHGRLWQDIALPLCRGMAAHARNEFFAAAEAMAEVRPHWRAVGGSHAQRDLFEQVYRDALARATTQPAASHRHGARQAVRRSG